MCASRDEITEKSPLIPRPFGESVIPARIVIGVTGHRRLNPTPQLVDQVRSAIQKIIQMAPPLKNTPLVVAVISPLAEGADRLVAQEVLRVPGSMIEVVLPLEKNDYMQDFETAQSRKKFEELLAKASSVKTLPPKRTRNEAYYQVGHYIVEHCDVLIALWDGNPAAGRGGTAEIVEYARATKHPLVWIHTDGTGQVTHETGRGLSAGLLSWGFRL